MYSIHGMMAIVLMIATFAHVNIEFNVRRMFVVTELAGPTGFAAMILLLLATLTGMFILSNNLSQKSRLIRRFKEKFFKREVGHFIHKLSIVAVVAIYVHMCR